MDFHAILVSLVRAKVQFIVVGGVSAVLQGVPTTTFDLELVHRRDAENRRRLLFVLRSLEACYREHLPKRLEPREEDLATTGHLLLMTKQGPLDLLGAVVGNREYSDLLPDTRVLELAEGMAVRVLDLETLLQHKEELGREKDLAQLPLLRRTLQERQDR